MNLLAPDMVAQATMIQGSKRTSGLTVNTMTTLAITGAAGRMGQRLIALAKQSGKAQNHRCKAGRHRRHDTSPSAQRDQSVYEPARFAPWHGCPEMAKVKLSGHSAVKIEWQQTV